MTKIKVPCSFCGNELESYEEYCSECGEMAVPNQDQTVVEEEDTNLKVEDEGDEEEIL